MTRRRFIYDKETQEMVEIPLDYDARARTTLTDSILWNDRSYQDMNDPRFTSRVKHREYMKRHGLATVDDFKDHFRKSEEKRVKVRQGFDPTRRATIERVIHQLSQQKRK